jgi:flagellar hook protein FlgE
MGFQTALSGLKAASTSLSVTGNNIANAQSVGFKESRAQFGDVYASSMGASGKTAVGTGVRVSNVAQQFRQGTIEATGNALDLAISGEGFFSMADEIDPVAPDRPLEATAFTRNGAFHVNADGHVVDDNGRYLLAFQPVKPNGTIVTSFNTGVKLPVQVETGQGAPTATRNVTMKLNLNGNSPKVTIPLSYSAPGSNVVDPKTYNHTTSITTYDSLGGSHIVTSYFAKTAQQNQWAVYTFIDGQPVTNTGTQENPLATPIQPAESATLGNAAAGDIPQAIYMTFESTGALVSGANAADGTPATSWGISTSTDDGVTTAPINANIPMSTKIDLGFILPGNAVPPAGDPSDFNQLLNTIDANGQPIPSVRNVAPVTMSIDFGGSTQFASPFAVNDLRQDGMAVGSLTGIDVDTKGIIYAKYSNGSAEQLGQVALARFANNQDLAKVTGTTWLETADSGNAIYGAGGDNNFGVIRSSSLENSNVDLSEQLVKLIVQQQAYQGNSQTISTEKSLLDTILRI